MKPCPFCGTMLTAALVASIIDPKQEESCPRNPKLTKREAIDGLMAREAHLTLATMMMLGSLVPA